MKERQAQEIRLVGRCNTVWCMIFSAWSLQRRYLLYIYFKIKQIRENAMNKRNKYVLCTPRHCPPRTFSLYSSREAVYDVLRDPDAGRLAGGKRMVREAPCNHLADSTTDDIPGRHGATRLRVTREKNICKYLSLSTWSKNHWKKIVENEQLHGCCIDPKVSKSHKTCNAMHSPAPRHPARNTFSIQQITEWPSSKNQKSPGMPKQNEDTVHPHVTSTPSIWAISTSHSHPHYGNRILPELKLDWDTKATVSNIIINIYQHLSNVWSPSQMFVQAVPRILQRLLFKDAFKVRNRSFDPYHLRHCNQIETVLLYTSVPFLAATSYHCTRNTVDDRVCLLSRYSSVPIAANRSSNTTCRTCSTSLHHHLWVYPYHPHSSNMRHRQMMWRHLWMLPWYHFYHFYHLIVHSRPQILPTPRDEELAFLQKDLRSNWFGWKHGMHRMCGTQWNLSLYLAYPGTYLGAKKKREWQLCRCSFFNKDLFSNIACCPYRIAGAVWASGLQCKARKPMNAKSIAWHKFRICTILWQRYASC